MRACCRIASVAARPGLSHIIPVKSQSPCMARIRKGLTTTGISNGDFAANGGRTVQSISIHIITKHNHFQLHDFYNHFALNWAGGPFNLNHTEVKDKEHITIQPTIEFNEQTNLPLQLQLSNGSKQSWQTSNTKQQNGLAESLSRWAP